MIVIKPLIGKISQGTIFNCAVAPRYSNRRVFGLILTARCDIANQKFPVLNFLPIVSLDDWMHCDGVEIAQARLEAARNADFSVELKKCDIAESILCSVDHAMVAKTFFRDSAKTRKDEKLADRVEGISRDILKLKDFNLNNAADREWIHESYPKLVSSISKELVNHKLNGYYFLENIEKDGNKEGYVVLMREIGSLSPEEADQLPKGIAKNEAPNPTGRYPSLSFEVDDFAMPIGQITSPYIEHILQNFSIMFGRIGLEDTSLELIDRICSRNFLGAVCDD